MAFPSQLLLSFLLFASLLFTVNPSSPIISDKVNLNLYHQSLYLACQDFIVEGLVKVFKTDLHTIVILGLRTVIYQNDGEECYMKAIEACAISIWPHQKKRFSFINYVESALQHSKETKDAWKWCVYEYGGLKQIKKCYDIGLATQFILGYGKEIDNLKLPNEYILWVTVNRKQLFEKYVDFVGEDCKAYRGASALPEVYKSSASAKLAKLKLGYRAGKMTMYKLAMEWGFGYCKTKNIACSNVKNYFTIHGFWPADAAGIPLPPYDVDTSCNPTKEPAVLTLQTVKLVIARIDGIDNIWPSYVGKNARFWKYEWDKHGKCCDTPKNPINYFSKAVYLAQKVKLKENLKKHGIEPVRLDYNHVQGIPANMFYDAMLTQLHKAPEIHCRSVFNKQRKTRFYFLTEIRLCFDDKYQLIDCPQGYSGACSRNSGLEIMYITW